MQRFLPLFLAAILTQCSRRIEAPSPQSEEPVIVQALATLPISMNPEASSFEEECGSRATTFTVDTSQFKAPPISSAMLDFGYLQVSSLNDTSINVCGAAGNKKCTKAMLQLYTTGVGGAGIYNVADSYGSPLYSALTSPLVVGLNQANAAIMQSITISGNRVRLSDFTPTPRYHITSDFTNAGKGTYQTTLVVEYALQ